MKRLPTTNHKIAFTLMLISGTALCVGGIWLAPLLIPGSALISGAVGMYSGTCVENDVQPSESKQISESNEDEHSDDVNLEFQGASITNQFHLHLRHRHGDHIDSTDVSVSPKRPRPR